MIMGFVLTLCSLLKEQLHFLEEKMRNENKASYDPHYANSQII